MPVPTKVATHGTEARALLIDQFRGQFVVQGILDTITSRIQELEDSIFDVIELRQLDNAEGTQLDFVGDLVGELRKGRADGAYREAIRLRIRVSRSQGRAEDVMQVVSLATNGDFIYTEVYPAGIEVQAYDVPAAKELQFQIKETRPAAVRGMLISSNWSASENFVFGSVYGAVTGESGFGSVSDPTIVSKMTSAQEA